MNREKVLKYLKEIKSNNDKEIFIALLIYERLDLEEDDVTSEIIEAVEKLYNKYDSIFNPNLNDELECLIEE